MKRGIFLACIALVACGDDDSTPVDSGTDTMPMIDGGIDAPVIPDTGTGDAGPDAPTDCPTDCSELDDDCNVGVCNDTTFECEAQPVTEGTACGDATDDECTMPDTCDDSGVCQPNHVAADTACGDATETECDLPDTCDGAGVCGTNPVAADTACGDPTETECDLADTCDGSGTCGTNLVAADTACGDATETECDLADACDGAGACDTRLVAAGTACGDATETGCDLADTCDGVGACATNVLADGDPCDTCPAGAPYCAGCNASMMCEDIPGGTTCIQGTITLGTPITGDTTTAMGGMTFFDPSCGGGSDANDDLYVFTAAADGFYVFDTFGSAYDTVVSVHLGAGCDGADEIACNDDAGGTSQSQVSVPLSAGERVTVNVNGFGTDSGAYTLNSAMLTDTCPSAADLGTATGADVSMGMNAGADDVRDTSCQSNTGGEVYLQWTAPAAGDYTFDTSGSDYDTVLAILDGCDIGATELACDDDGGTGLTSSATLTLAADQTVIIQIDAFGTGTGTYTLNITAL